jgi:hypothetical protein
MRALPVAVRLVVALTAALYFAPTLLHRAAATPRRVRSSPSTCSWGGRCSGGWWRWCGPLHRPRDPSHLRPSVVAHALKNHGLIDEAAAPKMADRQDQTRPTVAIAKIELGRQAIGSGAVSWDVPRTSVDQAGRSQPAHAPLRRCPAPKCVAGRPPPATPMEIWENVQLRIINPWSALPQAA